LPIKQERNQLVVKLYNEGKANQEILAALQRAGYRDLKDTRSLTGTIARLKRAGKLSERRVRIGQQIDKVTSKQITKLQSKQVIKSTSKQVIKSTSKQVYKRATYYLALEVIKQVKILAIKRDVDASALVRDILTKYLSRQGDL